MNPIIDIVIPIYNDNDYISGVIDSINTQIMPKGWCVNIYVVDDASDIPVRLGDDCKNNNYINVIRLESNQGCSVARNRGAFEGKGEVILFLDADCRMTHEHVLSSLIESYLAGYNLCFGQISVPGDAFWAKYQNDVAGDRARRFLNGDYSSMTTSIVLVSRQLFSQVGGFDEGYHYGFEDRDLFIRLIKNSAKVKLIDDVLVEHNDKISLISVAKKMIHCGKYSSVVFFRKHPEEYRKMAYAKVDYNLSARPIKYMLRLLGFLLWPLVRFFDYFIKSNILPYGISKNIVKILSGIAYMRGTQLSSRKLSVNIK